MISRPTVAGIGRDVLKTDTEFALSLLGFCDNRTGQKINPPNHKNLKRSDYMAGQEDAINLNRTNPEKD